jgi:hypothetical protein
MVEQPSHQRTRRWKRTAAAALLLLIGGAIVNVAVVAILAIWPFESGSRSLRSFFSSDDDPSWRMMRVHGVTFDRLVWRASLFRGDPPPPLMEPPNWSRVVTHAPPEGEDFNIYVIEDARGWPMLGMSSITFDYSNTWMRPSSGSTVPSDGLLLDRPGWEVLNPWTIRVFPLRPIWLGFIINTLFYALLLWLIFFAPFAARRVLRRKRRLCAKCAYPVGVSPVCSECGAGVRPRANENKAAI